MVYNCIMDANKIIALATKAVESLVEETLADDLETLPFKECESLAERVGIHVGTIIAMVKSYGISIGSREVPKAVRGFKSSSHDRWYGPGSCKTHGGTGEEQITGFAGRKG